MTRVARTVLVEDCPECDAVHLTLASEGGRPLAVIVPDDTDIAALADTFADVIEAKRERYGDAGMALQ